MTGRRKDQDMRSVDAGRKNKDLLLVRYPARDAFVLNYKIVAVGFAVDAIWWDQ